MKRMTRRDANPSSDSDADLLRRFAQLRDASAFDQIVARHGPMVLGVCRRILRNASDTDDAFQAAFLLLAMRASKIRAPDLLGHWLYGVAARTALTARRSTARRAQREKRLMQFLTHRKTMPSDDADLRMTLDEQIQKLPDKLRRVVVCCYVQGLTKRQAAKALDWAEGTVTSRLKEARELLKKRLGGQGLSEDSLASVLSPVAVPALLHSATVNAGAAIATGKIATAVSAKALSMTKATAKAMAAVKVKVAAAVIVTTAAVAGTAAVTQLPRHPPTAQPQIFRPTATTITPPTPPPTTQPAPIPLTTSLPPELERAVRENELSLDPITVFWTYQNYAEVPTTQPAVTLRANPSHFVRRDDVLYWQGGRIYKRTQSIDQGVNEVSYDGRVWYLCNTYPNQPPRLSKELLTSMNRPAKPIFRQTWLNDDYFVKAGLRALSSTEELAAGHAVAEIIALIEGGGQIVSVENINRNQTSVIKVHVLADNDLRKFADQTTRPEIMRMTAGMTAASAKRFVEDWEAEKKLPLKTDFLFYFDPAKNYAVVGREERYGAQILSITTNEGFRQVPGRRVWLQGKSVTIKYTFPNDPPMMSDHPLWRHEIELKELKVDPVRPEQFVVDYHTPGTHVTDSTSPGNAVSYTVKATREGIVKVGPPPGPDPLAHATPADQPADHRPVMIISIAAIAAVPVAVLLWLRRTNRPAR
jgi:RNA polymerase sigma factor (sigma-70 family)